MYTGLNEIPGRNVKLSEKQQSIIEKGEGPLWIIAGPGSGKTEVLVLRCLKLLLVDGVDPRSIMITTFTEKAARNLKDRLINYKAFLATKYQQINSVDLFQLRLGTLHSLCNTIMQEFRYPKYKNYRPLDDLDQLLFIYFNCPLVQKSETGSKIRLTAEEVQFWWDFQFVWEGNFKSRYYIQNKKVPSKWIRAYALQLLFNRITEDMIDIDKMRSAEGSWMTLANAYLDYNKELENNFRIDFANIQKRFLEFLNHELGKQFLSGYSENDHIGNLSSSKDNAFTKNKVATKIKIDTRKKVDRFLKLPPVKYLLVDEYQDTNPIQESIYLRMADLAPHNICVVGDDDQALYRFRGGTVDCMINFGTTLKNRFGVELEPIPLIENYRSHPLIVDWCNEFPKSFSIMQKPGARVKDKPLLTSKSNINGNYVAVSYLSGKTKDELASLFAHTVKGLLDNKIISDPSDCVLLLQSTRYSQKWAKPYTDALFEVGIQTYNPRSRSFLEEEEIMLALGTFLEIVDPNPKYEYVSKELIENCTEWRHTYTTNVIRYPKLGEYVKKSKEAITKLEQNQKLTSNMQDILFHILSYTPFKEWLEDPERTIRLGELTRLFEAYSGSPIPKKPGMLRGDIRTSSREDGVISWAWISSLYSSFITLLAEAGHNDPEDEDLIYPKGSVPIMTIHQAKGLEFPFVFVGGLNVQSKLKIEHHIEERFNKFRIKPMRIQQSADEKSSQDIIRLFFVAYSRAKYALILLLDKDDLKESKAFQFPALGGKGLQWFTKFVRSLEQ